MLISHQNDAQLSFWWQNRKIKKESVWYLTFFFSPKIKNINELVIKPVNQNFTLPFQHTSPDRTARDRTTSAKDKYPRCMLSWPGRAALRDCTWPRRLWKRCRPRPTAPCRSPTPGRAAPGAAPLRRTLQSTGTNRWVPTNILIALGTRVWTSWICMIRRDYVFFHGI